MRKFTLFCISICLLSMAIGVQAQVSSAKRHQMKNFKVLKPNFSQKGVNGIGQLPVNPTSNSKSALDEVLMITRYDLQTNASNENRIHLFTDGTVGACAMLSHQDDFTDRGTGTNFFDGTTWGTPPSVRIESSKSGWPSYAPWGPDGEIVVNHHMLDGLYIMTRATKGTGPWNEAILPGPVGAVDISWPRVVTNGPDNMYIHIICLTYTIYQNLDLALLYYRSLDGGATWDMEHRVIDGLTSADYLGFSADMYGWAQPKGDTLAFCYGDSWHDLAIMKSTNNGTDWDQIVVWPCPYNLWAGGDTTGTFLAPDGTVALALDNDGKAHLASGIMYASGDDLGNKYWVPFSDGLIYWNEDMPQLPVILDWDALYADGTMIGWATDTNVFYVDPTQLAYYYNSMTSQPTISVDENNHIFVIWSGMTMNLDPDNYMLRHIYARGSTDFGNSWTTSIVDLTSDFLYTWSECVYPSVSWNSDDYLYFVFQEDDLAGVSLNGAQGAQGQIAIGNNDIKFMQPLKADILTPVGIDQKRGTTTIRVFQNYPNPVADRTVVKVSLTQSGNLSMEMTNMMGQEVMNFDRGTCATGNHYFTVDTRGLAPGIYFYTITFNNEKVTKKMIVE